MNINGLIIQRTTAGLNDVFVSENLKAIRMSSEIEETTDDENQFATRLANQSEVYAVQITVNYRVYSLIISDIADSFGRAGFYAIRLYAKKSYPIADFQLKLQEINKQYLEFERNGTPNNSQNYDDLLNNSLPLEVRQQYYLNKTTNLIAFCFYSSHDSNLPTVFNSKNIALYKKLYAFDKDKAVGEELITSLGLISIEKSESSLKEVLITNNHNILKELKINGNSIEFNTGETELLLMVSKEDVIEFNTTDNSIFKRGQGSFINVERRFIAPPSPPRTSVRNEESFLDKYGMYLIMLFMTVIIGGGIWYFIESGKNEDNPKVVEEKLTKEVQESIIDTTKNEINFQKVENEEQTYFTNHKDLNNYKFRVLNGTWEFKNDNSKDVYNKFYITTVETILDEKKITDKKVKEQFVKELENISGKIKIEDKPKLAEDNNSAAKKKKDASDKQKKVIPNTEQQDTKSTKELKEKTNSEVGKPKIKIN